MKKKKDLDSSLPSYFPRDKFVSWGTSWRQNTNFQAGNSPCKSSLHCNQRNSESVYYISCLLMQAM